MIRCCNGCKEPKRHIGCHATCPEYIAEKEKHEADREDRAKEREAFYGAYSTSLTGKNRAMKDRRHGRKVY